MKIDKIEEIEMVPEWIRTAWEKKNLTPDETLMGLFLEKEQMKRKLSVLKWVTAFAFGIYTATTALVTSCAISRLDGKWSLFILWSIMCFVVAGVILYCLVRKYNSVLDKHYKRSSYIAEKLAVFKFARKRLDQVYDERPEAMRKYLVELAVELVFAEEKLRAIRTNLEKTTYELGFVLRQEEECRQKFDNTLLTLHESFGLFTEFTRPEVFRSAQEMISRLRKA